MDPDLVHAPGARPAEDDGGGAVEAEALELGVAVLAVGRHLAHPDLVAHNLDRLLAVDHAPETCSCLVTHGESLRHNSYIIPV